MTDETAEFDDDDAGFIVQSEGPEGVVGLFEDDGQTGYLYICKAAGEGITRHVRVYVRSPELNVQADDVQVEWSRNLEKCGVKIWGKLRAIIDLHSRQEGRVLLESKITPGIGDASWLEGFDC